MHTKYQEIASRFREERERLNLTQEELCGRLYMSQGHYCKAEQGKNRFTYSELLNLVKVGVDLHYVYTGERLSHLEYYTFFTSCGPEEVQCLAEIFFPLAAYSMRSRASKEAERIQQRVRHVQCLLTKDRQEESYLYRLRRYKSYSQRYMAGLLGVDIKKYTSMEKQKSFGDSEILMHIYNHFGISPLIMLHTDEGLAREICALLELSDESTGQGQFQYIKSAYENWVAQS